MHFYQKLSQLEICVQNYHTKSLYLQKEEINTCIKTARIFSSLLQRSESFLRENMEKMPERKLLKF